jgi:hypothetical protein
MVENQLEKYDSFVQADEATVHNDKFNTDLTSVAQVYQLCSDKKQGQGHLKTYIHIHTRTYHSRFIPEGVAKLSQIFHRNTHVSPKLVSYEDHCRSDRW